MTRQADPKVKDNIHVRARSETERRIIGELKQLANQDEVEIADLIFEGIAYMFKVHHWPPGNPQLQLTMFQNGKQPSKTESTVCECGRPLEIMYRLWQDKKVYRSCKQCFNKIHSYKIEVWGPIQKKNK
ncbi:MAG: hypothetical protein LBI79_10785 [Nitrososphaerota archaeon]|nr:hypothetical protein [Nitrososphaerota archaeon]